MPRPRKCRKVCCLPDNDGFVPISGGEERAPIVLNVDEYEAIRLIDREGFSQEQCGEYMRIARTTVQQIYAVARKKLADALVEGLPLRIEGGDVALCSGNSAAYGCRNCYQQKIHPMHEKPKGDHILSFNMGAKNDSRIKETYKKAIAVAMVFGAVALALFQLFPRQIVSIFGSGDELYFQFAERYMRVYMMLVCLHGVQPLSVNYFTAIGNVRQGIVLSLSRQGFFLIPLLLLLPLPFGLDGALYAGSIADSLACMLSLALVFRNFRELTAMRVQG